MGNFFRVVVKFPSRKRKTSKRRSSSSKRRSEEPDYIALGVKRTRKLATEGARRAKPHIERGVRWAAPRTKKAVVVGSKKGLELAAKGGRGAISLARGVFDRYKSRGTRREIKLRRKEMIFRGDFYMRPGHVVLSEEEYEKLKKGK